MLIFKLLKPLGTFLIYQYLQLSTTDFKLAKSTFFDVSIPVAFFKSAFVAKLDKSKSTFIFAPKKFGFGKYYLIHTISVFINPAIK